MIKADNLGLRYESEGSWTFRRYDFAIRPGTVTAVLGPNGRGKTSLLKTLLGLRRATEGRVRLDGAAGYVPQISAPSFPYSVFETVVMGRARHIGTFRAPDRHDYEAARAAIKRLKIDHLTDRIITTLSGGERQLVLMARALASDCAILVLDEPTSALDYRNQQVVIETIAGLSRKDGLTVVFTTHTPHHAVLLADDVLLMRDPETYDFGPARSVLTEERLSTLYGIAIRRLEYAHAGQTAKAIIPVLSTG